MAIAEFFDRSCLALRASGLWLRYATLQNLIPSFLWIAPPHPPPWRNPRKGIDPILPSGNLAGMAGPGADWHAGAAEAQNCGRVGGAGAKLRITPTLAVVKAVRPCSSLSSPSSALTGPGKRMVPRLREFFRQGQAEVVSNSKNKILATWEPFFAGPCRSLTVAMLCGVSLGTRVGTLPVNYR